jgi:hypothetical protein
VLAECLNTKLVEVQSQVDSEVAIDTGGQHTFLANDRVYTVL